MRPREPDHLRVDRLLGKSPHIANRLCIELVYNWSNGRIWLVLLFFWCVLVEVRLLSATNDTFQVVLKDASLRRVTSYSSPRYLMFDVCGDNGDKLMALLDGLAYAYEVNVSVVIPKAKTNTDNVQYEWSLDDLIDVDYLASHLAQNVTIYRQSPVVAPRIMLQSQKLDLSSVPPRQRAGTLRETFDAQQVVHLACPRWTFLWTMPYHAVLRRQIILAFRPPKPMESSMSQLSLTRAKGYNCLAERLDDAWVRFCKAAEQRTDNMRVMSWKECFISSRRVLDYVMHSNLARSSALYVSGQNETFLAQLSHAGLRTYSSASTVNAKAPSLPRDMLDWYVCLGANISSVNSYSSLGFLQREARYLLNAGATEYYNQEATFCPRILCKEEQRRWHLDSALYASTDDQRRTWVSEMKVNGLTVAGLLRVAKSCRFNFGIGWSCKTAPFTFSCSVDGKVHHPITASLVERPMSGDYEFSWRLPFTRPGRYVAHVWAHSETTKFEMDGSPVAFDVPGMNFFLYAADPSHHCARGLYHLHHELVSRFGNVSYVYPKIESLLTPYTRTLDAFREDHLTSRDVLIISDASYPQDTAQRLNSVGVKIVRWILEQPMDIVTELHNTGGILPLCSSHHFVDQYACPPKALIGRPISAKAVEASERGNLCNKPGVCNKRNNMVLIDHNAQEQASTGISAEQLQAALGKPTELVAFSDLGINDLIDHYKRARIAVDLFVSGNEPLLLEASLFNVCPLVAYHGSARNSRDFPLPQNLFLDIQNITNAAATISKALSDCSPALLTKLKAEALALHGRFPSQVTTYFSDNVLFYIICRTQEDEDWAVPTVLALLINYPFADIELVVRNDYFFRYDNAVLFELLGRKSFAKSVTVTQRNSVDRNHQLDPDMFMINRPMARHLTTWIYQWPPGDIALSSELVQENVGLYEEAMEGTDRMTAVIRRAPPSQRNGLSSDAPQFFFQQDLHFDMLAMHEARVATETHEPAQPAVAKMKNERENKDGKEDDEREQSSKKDDDEEKTTEPPEDLSEMRSEQTAEELGFLLLQEQMSGTWRVGGQKTQGMCDNWVRLQEHELWRSGAAFLADNVGRALTHLTESCREQHPEAAKRVTPIEVDSYRDKDEKKAELPKEEEEEEEEEEKSKPYEYDNKAKSASRQVEEGKKPYRFSEYKRPTKEEDEGADPRAPFEANPYRNSEYEKKAEDKLGSRQFRTDYTKKVAEESREADKDAEPYRLSDLNRKAKGASLQELAPTKSLEQSDPRFRLSELEKRLKGSPRHQSKEGRQAGR